MKNVLLILELIISISLIALIAIQGKGGGLGSAFGASYAAFSKRRGIERFVFQITIFFAAAFFIISLVNLLS